MGIGKDAHNDDYPIEGYRKIQPPLMDDGPNPRYVLRNQRVVHLVRPVVTRQVFVNGKPVKEEQIVGDYEEYYGDNHDPLKENLDNLGIINGFLNQVQMEASLPPYDGGAFPGRRPAAASLDNKPNWGSRDAWVVASDDDSFSGYGEYPDQTQDHYRPDPELPKLSARPNWPNSRYASPSSSPSSPRSPVYSIQSPRNSYTKPASPFQDNSPTRYGDRFEASRPKIGSPVRQTSVPSDDSPTMHRFERKDQRQDSPPLKQLERMDIKDHSQESSPKQNVMDAYMAKSGSNAMKHGTIIDVPDQINSSTELVKNGDTDHSLVKDSERSPNWPNKKSQDHQKEGENQVGNLEGGYSMKESSNATKPRFYGEWYKPARVSSQGNRGGGYGTKHWSEITPNPPPELSARTVIDAGEGKRQFGYMKSTMPRGYFGSAGGYGGAMTSEEAVRKYGGIFIPPN